jgi:hypothetical protein
MTVVDLVLPTDVPTSMTLDEGAKLAELARGQSVLELGAWQGFSTICLAQTATVCHSVDWHGGDENAGFSDTLVPYLRNLQRYGMLRSERVVVHIGRFHAVCDAFRDGRFDGVFVDGAHDYKSVIEDGKMAWRLARKWIAFHDYGVDGSDAGGPRFAVAEAVAELFGSPSELVDTLAVVRL